MLRATHLVSLAAALLSSWLQLVACTTEGLQELSWFIPLSGLAKDEAVSRWVEDVEVSPEAVGVRHRNRHPGNSEQHLLSNEPWLRHNPARGTVLILLGEAESEIRLHGSEKTATKAIGSGAVNTGGQGSGSNAGSGSHAGSGSSTGSVQATAQQATGQQVGDQQGKVNTTASLAANTTASQAANTNASQASTSGVRGAQKQLPGPVSHRTWLSIFRYSVSFALILKALCISSNVCVQATPMGTVRAFAAKGDTGDLDMAPFISCAYGGWQWCFYGLFAYLVTHKSGFLVLVYSNCVGATLGLYYVFTFTSNCKNKGMLERSATYYYVLGTIVTVQVGAICVLQPVRALFFCGLISSCWSIIGSLSLLTTVPQVFATKNSSSLQLPLLVCGEISALLWFACGVMLWDPWITFPSMFSGAACTYAHSLCIRFPARDLDDTAIGLGDDAALEGADHSAETSPSTWCRSPVSLSASPSFTTRSPPATASPWPLSRALNLVRGRMSSTSPLLRAREEASSSFDAKFESANYGAVPGTGGTGESPL